MLIIESLTDRLDASFVAARVAKQRQTPTRRCAIVSSYIVLLCLTVADPVPALGAALVLDTSIMASAGGDIAALDAFTALSGADLPQVSEPVRLASLSGEWKTFLKKTRINRLPRSIARSLRRLDEEKWWPTGKRRKAVSAFKSRYARDAANILQQTNQIAIEHVAIPHPSGIIRDDEAGSVLATPAVTRLSELLSGNRLFVGAAIACLVLMAGYLAHHYRASTFQSRKRIHSEKALYDAIAKLPQEAAGFESAVGIILDCIEEAYGLSAASIAVFDRETVAIRSIYSSQARAPTKDRLLEEAIVELHKRSGALKDQTLWRYPEPVVDARDDQVEPDAVTSVAWNGTRTGVMMAAQCRPGRYTRATDANTLQLVTQILAKVIDGRRDIAPSFPSSASSVTMLDSGEELAGAIAHEFNNLLMPIMGYAEMAADALKLGSYPRTYVERIQSAGERAKRVVEQILAFSRQQQQHSYGSFDVAAATAEILPDLKMCVPASTNFRVRLPDGPVRLRGNALALQQAVLNLCKNAGEAVADGGTITLGVTVIKQSTSRNITHGHLTPGRYVRVSVSDTGAGIPITDLRRIFDPFFTTRGEEGGTGLGLPMVLRAIKLLDGCINVRSSPSWGTRFDLFLPYPTLSGHDKYDATDLRDHVGGIAAI